MGVRTRRGSAAVYAPYWQRAIRTPVRAALTFVVLLGLIVAGASLAGSGGSSSPTANAPGGPGSGPDADRSGSSSAPAPRGAPGRAPVRPSISRPPPVPATATPPPLVTPAAPAAAAPAATAADPGATAAAWTQAWFAHQGSPQQWIDGLQPYTTREYLGLLGTVDLRQLPNGSVAGNAAAVSQSPRSAVLEVPTTALRLRLSLVQTPDGWRVASADQAA